MAQTQWPSGSGELVAPPPCFTLITSLTSNYIHSAPSLRPPPLFPADPNIHLSISAPSCLPSTSVSLPLCPLGLTRTHVFIHISILSRPLANQRVAPPLSRCQPGRSPRPPARPPPATLSPALHAPRHPFVLAQTLPLPAPSPVLPCSSSLSLLFPIGLCLRFSVNLPENALAVMKAEGRGNPPGFH